MRGKLGVMLLIGLLLLGLLAMAQGSLTKATIIESWFIHSESVGDPVAVEKGFYRQAGLDVTVVGGGPGLSPIDRVMAEAKAGRLVLGIDYPYNLLEARQKQKLPLVIIAADFQQSAMRILSWQPISKPSDIKGTFATWIGYDKPIKALIGKGWEKQIQVVNQQGDPATLGGWLAKQYPFASAMIYNEIMVAEKQAKEKYYVYDYKDFGIDWPENVLFTTEEVLRKYPNEVRKFVQARYRGFRYALDNPQEAGKILLKYNANLDIPFELAGLEQIRKIMVTAETQQNGLGYLNVAKLQKMAQQLHAAGLVDSPAIAGLANPIASGVK